VTYFSASRMAPQLREVVRFTSGNAVGVVVEPVPLDPARPLHQQQEVRIGVLDEERARREPFPADDVRIVTEQLRHFLSPTKQAPMVSDSPSIPRFNVASQWVSSSGLFAVQLVELAATPVEQLLGGTFAIRVCLMDHGQQQTCAFTVNRATAEELGEYVRLAIESHDRLSRKKPH
jgi:hypothetical protein